MRIEIQKFDGYHKHCFIDLNANVTESESGLIRFSDEEINEFREAFTKSTSDQDKSDVLLWLDLVSRRNNQKKGDDEWDKFKAMMDPCLAESERIVVECEKLLNDARVKVEITVEEINKIITTDIKPRGQPLYDCQKEIQRIVHILISKLRMQSF